MRHSGKLLVGLAAFVTMVTGNITAARAQGFLELEQTPAFIGLGAGSVPDYKARTIAAAASPPTPATPSPASSATCNCSPTN